MPTKKKTKKEVKKKAAPVKKKVAAPKSSKSQELVIRVQQQEIPVVRAGDLQPMKEGGKFMLPKTWISEKQVLYMVQKTPKKYVYSRPAKGGGNWDFVPGWYITKVLNYVFGWNWDFEILTDVEKHGQIVVKGRLTVKDDHGHAVTKGQYGRADIKFKKGTQIPVDYGNDFKAAATDCLKKCASMFGIAHDIYGKEESKSEAGIDIKDDAPAVADHSSQETADAEPTVQYGEPVKRSRALPRDNTMICSNCGDDIDAAVFKFSTSVFKRALCRECQKNAKKR